jgi:hypothetical protein
VASEPIPAWGGPGVSDQDASAWWTAQIGEFVLPGICTCEGFDRAQELDEKKSKGNDGATLEDNGRPLAKGVIHQEITAADWPLAHKIMQSLDPQQKGAVRQPQALIHPHPNALGVTQIRVRKVSITPPTAVAGMVINYDCIEWTPQPKPAKAKKTVNEGSGTSIRFEDGPDGIAAMRAWELAQASNDQINDGVGNLDEDTFEANTTDRARVQRFPE